jgi:hypothetical protein
MPATSAKQKKFMDAAAHNPAFAKEAGIPVGVAKEFSKESKGKTFGGSRADLQKINKPKTDHGKSALLKEGGYMKDDMKQDKSMVKKAVGMHDKQLHGGKKTDLAKLKKGGKTSCYANGGYVRAADGIAKKGKTKGTIC